MNACPSAGGERVSLLGWGEVGWGGVGWAGGFLAALPLWDCSTDVRTHGEAAVGRRKRRRREWKHVSLRGLSSSHFSLLLSLSFPLVLPIRTPPFHCGLVNFSAVPRLRPFASTSFFFFFFAMTAHNSASIVSFYVLSVT